MSEFKKYKSIENSYREKHIRDMMKLNPVYAACKYVVTEKLDGGNFQFRFTIDDTAPSGVRLEYGKRSSILAPDAKFYNYQAVVSQDKYLALELFVVEFLKR